MFFNNDSIVVVSAILVLGIFTYTFYNNIFTTVHNTSNTILYKEVGVQTESLVNTIPNKDPISELPESTYPCIQPNDLPSYVDAEVQTKSLWELLKEIFSMNDSYSDSYSYSDSVRSSTNVRVEKWMDNLDPSQSIPASDVVSGSSESNIQELIEVSDLIYENSESNIQGLIEVYDLMNSSSFGQAFSQPNAIFDHIEINSIHHYFIFINDLILSVNPDLITCFI
jgi:hypothetical protein